MSSTFKDGGLAGFAFMVRGEVFDRLTFDEDFAWWYGVAVAGRIGPG